MRVFDISDLMDLSNRFDEIRFAVQSNIPESYWMNKDRGSSLYWKCYCLISKNCWRVVWLSFNVLCFESQCFFSSYVWLFIQYMQASLRTMVMDDEQQQQQKRFNENVFSLNKISVNRIFSGLNIYEEISNFSMDCHFECL